MQCHTNIIWLFLLGCVAVVQSRTYEVYITTGNHRVSSRVDVRLVGDKGTTAAHIYVPPGKTLNKNSKYDRRLNDRDVGYLFAVEFYLYPGSTSLWSLAKVFVWSNGIYSFPSYGKDVKPGRWTRIVGSCPLGFDHGANGNCVDKDECKSNPCSGPTVTCVNTYGSYRCECARGYRLRYDTYCEDIDECLSPNKCEQNCHNTQGSYRCECRRGFRLVEWTKCADINECQEGTHNCDKQSTYCSNVRGTFYCKCNPGYYPGGSSTSCEVTYCNSLKYKANYARAIDPSRCLKYDANRYMDTCTMKCKYGYEVEDPRRVNITCGKNGSWKGNFSDCRGVKCPPLSPVANAVFFPSTCVTVGSRHDNTHANCHMGCKSGYYKVGSGIFKCNANGTWSGSPATCKKYYPPPTFSSCPSNVYIDLPPGKNTTSLGSKWQLPTANVKNLTVSPSWANQFYEFPYGETKITWTATNPEGKTASCSLYIYVKDKEPPKVTFCPGPYLFLADSMRNSSTAFVKFKRPTFTDNVGVVSVSPEYKGGVQIDSSFPNVHKSFTARDKAGNQAICKFIIFTKGYRCSLYPDDYGYRGSWTPKPMKYHRTYVAKRICRNNTKSYGKQDVYTCSDIDEIWRDSKVSDCVVYMCNDVNGIWRKSKVSDCVDYVEANKTAKCPEGFGRSPASHQAGLCLQCPLGTFYKNVSGNQTCNECPAGRYQDKRGSTSCKTCPHGTSSLQGEYVCRALCPRGTFSKDGMRPFCSLCPQGQYQPNEGQTGCLVCPNNKFTNTKLGSYSCAGGNPPTSSQDLPVIERIVKPTLLNTSSEEAANVFECYIKDNNYDQIAVRWEVIDNGLKAPLLGRLKHEEIKNIAGKQVGARLTITRTRQLNGDVKYACNAFNPNGKTQRVVTVKSD